MQGVPLLVQLDLQKIFEAARVQLMHREGEN